MTKKSILLAAALAAASFTGTAFASSKSPATCCAAPAPQPVPVSVVNPAGLPQQFAGSIVNVEFTLDQTGQPRDIKVLRVHDAVLKRQLVAAFSQWRFTPGAAAKRFVLPVRLMPEV